MFQIWLQFAGCLAVILVAGTFLSRYGDAIAIKSGLGRTWIGLILLATVTSLPELFSGISAVTLAKAPNIAVGSLMGSNVFNLVLLFILDMIYREAETRMNFRAREPRGTVSRTRISQIPGDISWVEKMTLSPMPKLHARPSKPSMFGDQISRSTEVSTV